MLDDLTRQATELQKGQDDLLETISKKRSGEARAKIRFENAREKLEDLQRRLYVDKARGIEAADWNDPRTGEYDKDFADQLMSQLIMNDEAYVAALDEFHSARDELYTLGNDLADLLERFSVNRIRCRIVAALLEAHAG